MYPLGLAHCIRIEELLLNCCFLYLVLASFLSITHLPDSALSILAALFCCRFQLCWLAWWCSIISSPPNIDPLLFPFRGQLQTVRFLAATCFALGNWHCQLISSPDALIMNF